jgi:tungstate transport system substrate-binding protein
MRWVVIGIAAAVLVVVAVVLVVRAAAGSGSSSTVTVVGTSDVYDSGLIQNVIKPDFEKAYPQYTLDYVPQGSGAAIDYAEAGSASGLLVHAASLENQFVADGYSAEPYGRAVFYGDYVLLGPSSDPARVTVGGKPSHDVVAAFEKIASAGAAGRANFVSRGGTPGTTVEEHGIWALTTGVGTCVVTADNGGGEMPSTSTGTCSDTGDPPSWYHSTGLTQGPNIINADVCNYPTASGNNNCYVLTDRGTYQYLVDQHELKDMTVVADDNAATAPGGPTLLVNSFHAYAVNPAKFTGKSGVHINLAGATALLNWLTSPAGQAAVSGYQQSDPGGPSFIGDAHPALRASRSPSGTAAGGQVTVRGRLVNIVPGTPALNGVRITLSGRTAAGSSPTEVTSATTDADGRFVLRFNPESGVAYTVSSPSISKIEIGPPKLDPPFGDLLQPTTTDLGG